MPAGYSSKCKTCNSRLRLDIERWHEEGLSDLAISKKLRELSEPISDKSLTNHFAEHYNIQAEVQDQYQQSQANLQEAAAERVIDITMLEDVAREKYDLHQRLSKILGGLISEMGESKKPEDFPKLPAAYVALYNGCAAEIRQALKTRQELLGEDGEGKKARAMESWVDLMLED